MEKLTVTVPEAAKMLGLGLNKMYELVHRADFPTIRVGTRIIIPVEALKQWVVRAAESGEGGE